MLTRADFLAFYPQFASFSPGLVLDETLIQANARFSDFGEDTAEARRLFTAHKLTLYAMSYLPSDPPPSMEAIAAAGKGSTNKIASKKVGEVQITYATSTALSSGSSSFQDLTQTSYGLQLLSLLKLHGYSRYIP